MGSSGITADYMGTRATTYLKIRSPEEKKRFKMSQRLLFVFVLILALSLIVSEAAPQWRRNKYRNRERISYAPRERISYARRERISYAPRERISYGGFRGGNTRQTLKTIGGKKIIGGLALKGLGAATGDQGLYNLGKTIAGLGVAKTIGAHLFNGK